METKQFSEDAQLSSDDYSGVWRQLSKRNDTPYHFITVHQHEQAADTSSQVRIRHRADSHRLGEAHGDTKQNFFVT